MRKDPTEFRERFLRWKKGELVYENGLALPAYEDGKSPRKLEYHPEGDYYYGGKVFPDKELVVTGHRKGMARKLYSRPWKTYGDLSRESNENMLAEIASLGGLERYAIHRDLSKPLSPVDPVGELIVGNAVLGPAFNYVGKGLKSVGNTIVDDALIQAGKSGSKWAKAKAVQRTMKNPVVPEKGFGVPYDDYNYYHGGLDSDFDFSKLDPFRKGIKQAKRGKDYAGFYMTGNVGKHNAFKYGGGEAHGIKISDDAKTLLLDKNIERLEASELYGYRNNGYDIVTGKNVWGEPEYILLNKNVIEDTKFFQNAPKNELHVLRYPNINFNPKRKRTDIDWINAKTRTLLNPLVDNLHKELQAVRNVSGQDINNAINKGFTERFAKDFPEYPQEVSEVLQKQVVPRRLERFKQLQQTDGTSKIQNYIYTFGDVDFSTPRGLKIAQENGWTFEEVQDYMQYKDFADLMANAVTGGYRQYPLDAWNLRHPSKGESVVTGTYNPTTDTIELPEGFSVSDAVHEARHRILMKIPTIQNEKNILHNAYDYDLRTDEEGLKILKDELETVNAELRERLLDRYNAGNMLSKTQNTLLGDKKWFSDDEILNALENTNAYGARIVKGIRNRIEQIKKSIKNQGLKPGTKTFEDEVNNVKSKIVDDIRYATQAVGISVPFIYYTNNETRSQR